MGDRPFLSILIDMEANMYLAINTIREVLLLEISCLEFETVVLSLIRFIMVILYKLRCEIRLSVIFPHNRYKAFSF
jgi:hypothetical protein